jgi:hypothetical protein
MADLNERSPAMTAATVTPETPAPLTKKLPTAYPGMRPDTDVSDQKPATKKVQPSNIVGNLLIAALMIGYLSFMFGWAITLGPIAVAGFFGWLTYLSMFMCLLWRDARDETRTYPGA